MKKAIKQFEKISPELEPCTNYFSSAWGIPCAHQIQNDLDDSDLLDIDFFNHQCLLTIDNDHLTLIDL